MIATTAPAIEVVAAFSDDTLNAVRFSFNGTVRDSAGNLRELTDAENEFIAAVRAEVRKRGLS